MSTGAATSSDIVIRKNGLSGFVIGAVQREFHCGFYFTSSLYNASNLGNFIIAIQNDFTPTLTTSPRAGIYVTANWNAAVSATTFSLFTFNNGSLFSSATGTTGLALNTLYAAKIVATNSNATLYINGALNLTVAATNFNFPLQMGVGLTKSSGTTAVAANVDYIGTFINQSSNTYII
jgi:hypothetical protein